MLAKESYFQKQELTLVISKPAFQFLQVSEPQKPIKTWKPGNRETQVPMLDCPKSGPGPLGPDTKGPGPGPDVADLDLES